MRGATLSELLVFMACAGILSAVGIPRAGRLADRLVVERQAALVLNAYQRARQAAWAGMEPVRLTIAPDQVTIYRLATGPARQDSVLLWRADGPAVFGVTLQGGPGPVVVAPNGLAVGVANGRYVLERGGVSRAVVVSRLGRLRVAR